MVTNQGPDEFPEREEGLAEAIVDEWTGVPAGFFREGMRWELPNGSRRRLRSWGIPCLNLRRANTKNLRRRCNRFGSGGGWSCFPDWIGMNQIWIRVSRGSAGRWRLVPSFNKSWGPGGWCG